ncbi:xanthine dehydrogenase family protein molybdopterin-binding subunit [Puniceibacterium sp. IMCC21224]|uniref:xanthine dehydrogenase family protein molybdopterin-binding subunit n=1 Tax=Puniceibacterium sp. IMCC21224 TaxID=1618204 RepID=UPI00064E0DED|nr:xanthine dehydrogenase family protein molybdopterin-binding subunit [Puniceibacterium sp. IMCC21224]KMK68488.1 xanthine dehydrogenase, molybdenum binding subunit apoprotein [Puniceibacterium sp. IMCC21224]
MSPRDVSARDADAGRPWIGRALPRFEDKRLLAGKGRYTDDFHLPNEAIGIFVRSPYAAAQILSIDTGDAAAMPGVLAVITGQDYLDEGGQPLRHFADPADARDHTRRALGGDDGNHVIDLGHLPMPVDRVRYPGEPVALVVAETLHQALDAAEAVAVDYEETGFVVSAEAALEPGAPLVDPQIPGNCAVRAEFGDRAAAEAAIAAAPCVIEQRFPNQRIVNAQMEPRSVVVEYDAASDLLHMIAGSQGAVRQRDTLAAALGLERDRVEVTCPDTGGGFGPRTNLSSEQPILAIAARRLGRPVRWTSTRSESFLTDFGGRDLIYSARMGLDSDGRILGYSCEMTGNVGAYTVAFVPMANSFRVMTTVYHVPAAGVRIRGAMTNTVPTAPYRGAGRPEATYTMERMLDLAARKLGLDRLEIRRRNLVPRAALPYTTAMGLTYDSGDFAANMAQVQELADIAGFDARHTDAAQRGKLAGIALANYIESPVGIPHERIDTTVLPDGVVEVVTGTQSTGQGHETSFAQVMADRLGVTPYQVRLISGDTRRVVSGGGSHSDRSMRLGGALMVETSARIVERARAIAAHVHDAAEAAVQWDGALIRIDGRNEALSLFDVARLTETADLPDDLAGPLTASASFTGRMPAYPTGSAVCEVEVDPETGQVAITRYTSIDDVGQPINPLILHGQVHGGIVQGTGQALSEAAFTDPDTGQVLTGSFMDYGMTRAADMPSFAVDMVEDPTAGNPLRVKGGGESGITPALATTMNAIIDALTPLGVTHLDMPATPGRVWEAIQAAAGKRGEQT